MAIRRKYISTVVGRLLEESGTREAPVDVAALAERMGISVHCSAAPEELSGFLYRDHERGTTIIGINSDHHPNRQRFTLAHELGHFLLHRTEPMHVDRSGYGFSLKLRDDDSSKGTSPDEVEANTFAAELLMPTTFLRKDLVGFHGTDLMDGGILEGMAARYGVSVQALTFRLTNLGYIQL